MRKQDYRGACCIRPMLTAVVICLVLLSDWTYAIERSDKQFSQLLEDAWQFELEENPLLATNVGDSRFNDQLPEVSLSAVERRAEARRGFLERLEAIDASELSPAGQINYQIFRRSTRDRLSETRFESHLMPITNRSGFHVSFPELARNVPLRTTTDYKNYIARLAAFERYADGHIELMREGIWRERTLPSIVLDGYRSVIESHIVSDPAQSLLFKPLRKFPSSVPAADRPRLVESAPRLCPTAAISTAIACSVSRRST